MLRLRPHSDCKHLFFFKFTAAPESVYIFTKVGLEPWGRIGSGVAELIAAILILIPSDDMAGRWPCTCRNGRRNFQPSHRARHRRDGRWRIALRPGAGCRRLQHRVALFATPAPSSHWSLSVKRSPLQDAIAEVLRQGESLLNLLSDREYTRKLPTVFGSTVGGHYRHCLDHFQSLLRGLDADEINYDHRERNPRIENDRNFALSETQRILRGFASISTPFSDCPINVRSKVNYELDAAPSIGSTVGRELMYAVAHAIHHYALIAVMCGMLEVPVPVGFGVAPSTLKYHAEQPKAA